MCNVDMFQIGYQASGKGPCVSVQAGVSLREYVKKDRYYHDVLCLFCLGYFVYDKEFKIIFVNISTLSISLKIIVFENLRTVSDILFD